MCVVVGMCVYYWIRVIMITSTLPASCDRTHPSRLTDAAIEHDPHTSD